MSPSGKRMTEYSPDLSSKPCRTPTPASACAPSRRLRCAMRTLRPAMKPRGPQLWLPAAQHGGNGGGAGTRVMPTWTFGVSLCLALSLVLIHTSMCSGMSVFIVILMCVLLGIFILEFIL